MDLEDNQGGSLLESHEREVAVCSSVLLESQEWERIYSRGRRHAAGESRGGMLERERAICLRERWGVEQFARGLVVESMGSGRDSW